MKRSLAPVRTLVRELIPIVGSFAPNSSSAVSGSSRKGLGWSVARTSAGLFTITFADTIPVKERGHGEDKPLAENVPEGTDPDAAELDAEIREYMDKNEVDYGKAFKAVADSKVTS